MKIEKRYCKECNKEVDHVAVIVKSQSSPAVGKKAKFKEFMSAFFAGWGAGAAAGFMELKDAHLVCNKCGHKIIEAYRGDLD